MTSSENYNEKELTRLLKKGDSAAMKSLYCQYAEYLTAVCSRYIISQEDVRDILHDSFIKIFTSIDRFEYRDVGSLKAWITRIVVNESLKWLKQNEKLTNVQDENEFPNAVDDSDPDTDNVPAEVILKMIRQLPAGYRTVFNLYVFEEKSHKEIAAILDIKEDTSASQLHRAKSMLVKQINEFKSTGKWKNNG